ncbi:TolC family protein [Tolumonas auensis]|uniref:TolC family protein n=1 Tax=Tolumonas auensis TaxID=43948 RepID=UPI002AA6A701|nr:TolC family protein [Tolumonas auensis]
MKFSMSHTLLLPGLFVSSVWAATEGDSLISLQTAVQENNPQLQQVMAEMQAASARTISAGALADPLFKLEMMDFTPEGNGTQYLPGKTGQTKYTLMQDLPWYGKRDLKTNVAQQQADAAKFNTAKTLNELKAEVRRLYVRRYETHQMWLLNQEIDSVLRQIEQITSNRYQQGLVNQQALIQTQLNRSQLAKMQIDLEAEQKQLQSWTNAILNRSPSAELAWPESLPSLSDNELKALKESDWLKQTPQWQQTVSARNAAALNERLVEKNRYPDFTVGVTAVQNQQQLEEWEGMVQFNLPLNLTRRTADEREAQAMSIAAKAEQQQMNNDLQSQFWRAVTAIEQAKQQQQLLKDKIQEQAALNLRSALLAYQNNQLPLSDLLQAEQQWLEVRQSQIQAASAEQMAYADIEALTGKAL